jgi:phage shock protein A
MKEKLRARVGRIISGSLNALVDAIEGTAPEIVLEESVREIDGVIDETRAEMGKVVAGKYSANKQLTDKHEHLEKLSDQIQIALQEGRDDLAEAAVSKQLDIEAQIPLLEQSIKDASDKETELEGYIKALQAKKREMTEELQDFIKAKAQATGNTSSSAAAEHAGLGAENRVNHAMDKASSVFDRVLSKQGLASGQSGHQDANTEAKLQELEKLSRENRIKERLAAIKSRSSSDKS